MHILEAHTKVGRNMCFMIHALIGRDHHVCQHCYEWERQASLNACRCKIMLCSSCGGYVKLEPQLVQ